MAPDAPSAGSVELGVDDGVGHRGKEPAGKIEDEIAGGAHAILDRSAEQPKRPHVEDQMQPSAVQEHVREERLPVGERVAEVEIRREIERGDERKAPEKGLELIGTQTPLVKENQAVRRLADARIPEAVERAHQHAAPEHVEQRQWNFTEALHRRLAAHQNQRTNSTQSGRRCDAKRGRVLECFGRLDRWRPPRRGGAEDRRAHGHPSRQTAEARKGE